MPYRSTKVIDGFSACFRQWKAEGTHCRFLHGYGVSVKVIFEGDLDERNWVVDFGGFKRSKVEIDGMKPKEWFTWLLDHTTIVAEDDPYLSKFEELDRDGVIQLRTLPSVGCEKFAEYIFGKLKEWVKKETHDRCKLISVEVREHEKNSSLYSE